MLKDYFFGKEELRISRIKPQVEIPLAQQRKEKSKRIKSDRSRKGERKYGTR